MRYILTSVVLAVLLFPALASGETVKLDDLVKRDSLYYKKFTDVPFSGKVTGIAGGASQEREGRGVLVQAQRTAVVGTNLQEREDRRLLDLLRAERMVKVCRFLH